MKTQSSKPKKFTVIVICGVVAVSGLVAGIYPANASHSPSTDLSKSTYSKSPRGLSAKDWKLIVKGN